MSSVVAGRRLPVELSADPAFARRVRRLGLVSLVALGAIWGLAVTTLDAPPIVDGALLAGWALMPSILFASLARPVLRYGLTLPATLVTVGLLAIVMAWLPASPAAAVGWVLILLGVGLGGAMGLWLWYRLLPVPAVMAHPFSPARWLLIGVHVALIVVGVALAAVPLFAG
ncbi:MAG: hypothetical protein ACXWWU_08375 [Candidatus Limnocylindria bacterium]